MANLVLADHDNRTLSSASARVASAAVELGEAVDIVVAGVDCAAVAQQAAEIAGIRRVILAEHAELENRFAEPASALLLALAADYDVLLASTGTVGKDVMPRVAALLDIPQISDIVAIHDKDTFSRPIFAGNAIETLRLVENRKVLTIRASSFAEAGRQNAAPILVHEVNTVVGAPVLLERSVSENERPELASASIVISGGRALGSREQFEALIYPLADRLNAAIGASRAAVDAGFAPNDWQVGQTGKVVAPELYIACGISGAVQHTAGMKDSKVIVAINSDPEAPIFQIADYGLAANLFEAIPQLIDLIDRDRS